MRVPVLVLLLVLVRVPVIGAAPQAQATQPSAQDRTAARLAELQQEAARLAREERTLLNELRRLQVDREMKAAELDARTIALDEAAAAVTALEQKQAALAETIARQQPLVRARRDARVAADGRGVGTRRVAVRGASRGDRDAGRVARRD